MWPGPIKAPVTQSILNKFVQCPYRAYLYLILGLEPDLPPNLNLVWGDIAHNGIEHRINGSQEACREAVLAKYQEWAPQVDDHRYEAFPLSILTMLGMFDFSIYENGQAEVEFDRIHKINGIPFRTAGKIDVLLPDAIGEHKCKGRIYPEQLKHEIVQDLQCNYYMFPLEIEWVHYDLIRIPDTQEYGLPRKLVGQTQKEFIAELYTHPKHRSPWNDFPIKYNQPSWIHQDKYFLPLEEQEFYWKTCIEPLMLRLYEWYDYVTSPEFDYQNPECYNHIFYRMPVRQFIASNTEKFECDYYHFLLGLEDIDSLRPVPSYYAELNEQN